MDTHNETRMASGELCARISGQKTVVGAKQIRRALTSGIAKQVYLAENADPAITEPIAVLCRQQKVTLAWVRSMADLGHACGIEVGAAAAAVVN